MAKSRIDFEHSIVVVRNFREHGGISRNFPFYFSLSLLVNIANDKPVFFQNFTEITRYPMD